uniref:Phage major capsid protein n=1 Tax=Geobacter sp. (strain M21) TaxID=443144 RepID=C6E6R1_GEOSM
MAVFKFEKDLYKQAQAEGLTLSQKLEQEAPSGAEGLDAFQFQLYERGINPQLATVERFYQTSEDSVLFPEFINRNVRVGIAGLGRLDLTLDDMVATTTTIDSGVYQTVQAQFDAKKIDFNRVAEGAPFPTVSMATGKESITLAKIGIGMDATYEVLRRMKLPLLAIHMQLIGQRLAKRMVAYGMYNVINGDGNANAAPQAAPAAISYENLLDFYLDMEDFEATVWAAKKPILKEVFKLNDFRDPLLFDTAKTGNLPPAFGYNIKKFNWTESILGDDLIVQIAKNAALELVKESGAELIETDKVIERQFQKTTISQVIGFSRIFKNAAYVFKKQ